MGLITLSTLALIATACTGDPKAQPHPPTPAKKGMPLAPPGQSITISSTRVNAPEGPVRSVYFPKPRDLAPGPNGSILVVSAHISDPLRLISPFGDVRPFNSRRPESTGAYIAELKDARTAIGLDDGSLLVYEADGDLTQLPPSGPLSTAGKLAVKDDLEERPAKLLRDLKGRILLVADNRMWRLDLKPKFQATKVTPKGANGPILAATTSAGLFYLATEDEIVATDKGGVTKHSIKMPSQGRPERLAPRDGGGVWLLTKKGAVIEIDGEGETQTRLQAHEPVACSEDQTDARELKLDTPSGMLQRGNQLYFTDTGLGCQRLRVIGLPIS